MSQRGRLLIRSGARRVIGLFRTPVVAFLLVAGLIGAAMAYIANDRASSAAQEVAIASRVDINHLLATSILEPSLRERLVDGRPGAIDKFDERALRLGGEVEKINIWLPDGTLIYSTDLKLVNQRFLLTPGQQTVFADGGTGYEVADPSSARNEAEPLDDARGLIQIYTRVNTKSSGPILFEGYYQLEEISSRRAEILSLFRFTTLAPLFVMVFVAAVMLQLLNRQIRRASRDKERLLQSAIDASDAERRRIARDLHDGVVQDLAGTAFAISGVARDPNTIGPSRAVLDAAGTSLRDGLKALRSLLAEIHPPDLHAQGLPAALDDLIAPAATAGIQASVSVSGVDNATDAQVALIWRVAQEAVRNAIRHSQASTLAVTVRGDNLRVVLEVVDDGIGFDPAANAPDRFGLRGLRSLVADVGGDLEVATAVGEGTTVRMAVASR